jgi:hypothetical protein
MPEEKAPLPQPAGTLSEDFATGYANQIRFETSSWDLKIVFGQLDQSTGTPSVEWHTAMTIPWPQAKIGLYFLQANVAIYEQLFGKIQMPWDVIPPPPTPPSAEEAQKQPRAQSVYETLLQFYEQFKATL